MTIRQLIGKRWHEPAVPVVASAIVRRGATSNRIAVRSVEPATITNAPATPVVKWAGGKTRLLPELLRRMPATYGKYYEPFAGGAALFFAARARAVASGQPHVALLSDTNTDLINVYRVIQTDVEALIKELARHKRAHGRHKEAYYYRARTSWNDRTLDDMIDRVGSAEVWRAGLFVFLNKTCFNGLWRVNSDGEFNVSYGDYAKPTILDASNLRAAAKALEGVHLRANDYRTAMRTRGQDPLAGDFVYFDPPYDPVSATANFVGYAAGGFGRAQQEELAAYAHELVSTGVGVMISNSNTAFIRKLYKGPMFKIDRVMCPRMINSDATKRGAVAELVIRGGYR